MIASDLRGDIEEIRSKYFRLLLVCTIIVAVGVVVEEIEHLASTGKWHEMLKRLGWLLVIIGVLGEGIFEAATTSADSVLQDFNNTLLAIATDQAGRASKSAKTAHDEAKGAGIEADKAKTDSGIAFRKSDEANTAASNAEGMAVKAKAQLEADEAKQRELERDLRPRIVAATGFPGVPGANTAPLEKFPGTELKIEYIPDFEARRAANSIAAIVEQFAKWKVTEFAVTLDPNVSDGVTIKRYSGKLAHGPQEVANESMLVEDADARANALAKFLTDQDWFNVDVGMDDWIKPTLSPTQILIIVGYKPSRHFLPEWQRKIEAASEEQEKRSREHMDKMREEDRQRRENLRKQFPNPFPTPPK
ncbi:hypothetical protein SBA7_1160006 [Candidatus Sulfotelmatobacter sp. SbA7]|jgi:hypothetical protein|nr:hypothetical protein SBA7_1160006 [Candidatus Sulfotelmatobacter sp. SbA7]